MKTQAIDIRSFYTACILYGIESACVLDAISAGKFTSLPLWAQRDPNLDEYYINVKDEDCWVEFRWGDLVTTLSSRYGLSMSKPKILKAIANLNRINPYYDPIDFIDGPIVNSVVFRDGFSTVTDSLFRQYGNISKSCKEGSQSEILYLIRMNSTDFYKIGRTKSMSTIDNRLKALSTGSPSGLTLIAWQSVSKQVNHEKLLHFMFKEFRQNGEWFMFNQKEVQLACHLLENLVVTCYA